MKVVVNKCFGGFGLSAKALVELIKINSTCVKSIEPITYYGGDNIKNPSLDWEERFNKDFERYIETEDGYKHDSFGYPILKDNVFYMLEDWYETSLRTNADLIKVVESLGKEANGMYADLKVVEIPDGVDFKIDDYDGMESIHEKHRSW